MSVKKIYVSEHKSPVGYTCLACGKKVLRQQIVIQMRPHASYAQPVGGFNVHESCMRGIMEQIVSDDELMNKFNDLKEKYSSV